MVLVTFRTINSKMYKIELDPSATISQAKQNFANETNTGEPSSMKMILKAKLLSDDTTIGSLNLGEKDFIVVHTGTKRQAPPAQSTPAPSQPAPPPAQPLPATSGNPTPQSGGAPPIAPLPEITRPAPTPAGQPPSGFPGAAPGAMGQPPQAQRVEDMPEFAENLTQLIELGYPRSECEAALKAAYGNPDRAAEYLVNGQIPDDYEGNDDDNEHIGTREISHVLMTNPASLENFIRVFEQNNPAFREHPEILLHSLSLDPSNFDIEAIRNRTAQPIDSLLLQQQIMQSRGNAAHFPGGMPGAGVPSPNPGAPDFNLGAGQPGTGGSPIGGAPGVGGAGAPGGTHASAAATLLAQFSPEEKEAIQRLQQLGNFPLPLVVQIYSASDKNEEIAANLLFSMND